MKTFQEWLDFQLYSSHLKNLTKIKQQTLQMRNIHLKKKPMSSQCNRRNITCIESAETRQKNSLYFVKLERKQNQINQENLNLASRLINVSSVISKDKQIQSYQKYQSIFKRNSSYSGARKVDAFRYKKMRKFRKIHEDNCLKGVHKAIVKLRFLSIPKIASGNEPTIWVQLHSGLEKIISSHYSLDQFLINQIKFPLKQKADRNIFIKIHCSRGLNYVNLGEYVLQVSKELKCTQFCDIESIQDPRKIITLNLEVQNLQDQHKVKFSSIR